MAEQAQKPQQPPQQAKPQAAPQAQPKGEPFDKQKLAEDLRQMLDPTKRFVVIDSDSFTVVLVSMLQIRDSELSTALLRRRQDFATNE